MLLLAWCALGLFALLVLFAGLAWALAHPAARRRVLVNLISTDQFAVRGVLWQSRGSWLVMKDAALVRPDGSTNPVDGGEVVIERRNVALVQRLP